MSRRNTTTALVFMIMALAVAVAYRSVFDHAILLFDDQRYLEFAASLTPWHPADWWRMAAAFHSDNWHPLTWFSLSLDSWLFGGTARGHHAVNLLLHAVNATLVYLLARRLLGSERGAATAGAAVAALLFALHPQHVEAVAWIAERKELLSAGFYLAALLSHLEQHRVIVPHRNATGLRPLTVGLGICALLAKPMAVSLPLALLAVDLYPLRRWTVAAPWGQVAAALGRLVMEKWLLVAAVLVTVVLTVAAQQADHAIRSLAVIPLTQRIINAAHSLLFYVQKFAVPLDLHLYYPYPGFTGGWNRTALALLAAATAPVGLAVWRARRGDPVWLAAVGWYLATLLPVIGLVQVGWQAAADRYAYLPTLPFYLAWGALIAWSLRQRTAGRRAVLAAAGALTLGFSALSFGITQLLAATWRDDETLWSYTNRVNPGHWLVESNLAFHLARRGALQQAIPLYRESLAKFPHERSRYVQLAEVYQSLGEFEAAYRWYTKLAGLEPDDPWVALRQGRAALQWSRFDLAGSAYARAVALDPDNVEAVYGSAVAHYRLGERDMALEALQRLFELAPDHAQGRALATELAGSSPAR